MPGVGKTTAIERTVKKLKELCPDLQIKGFYTKELRSAVHHQREGFEVIMCDTGTRVILAHQSKVKNSPYKVSKYAVDIKTFEEVVLPQMFPPIAENAKAVVVIDEIGKMECFSKKFAQTVTEILNQASAKKDHHNLMVVGTIALKAQEPFIRAVKLRADVDVWKVTRENRDAIPEQIIQHFLGSKRNLKKVAAKKKELNE